jgi:hypothetical protein
VTVAAASGTPAGTGPGAPSTPGEPHLAVPNRVAGAEACPLCGTPLSPEQDWCLHCGAAARTRLAATPNWRGPIITIAVIAVLALGVLAAALVKLAGGSGSATASTVSVTAAVTTTPVAPTTTVPGATTATPGASTTATATAPAASTSTPVPSTPTTATSTGAIGATPTKPGTAEKTTPTLTPAQREELRRFNERVAGK